MVQLSQLRCLPCCNYQFDERITLGNVKGALEAIMRSVKSARGKLDQVLGGCARQRPLAYDKATSLLLLVQEVEKFVVPLLQTG